MGGDQAVFEGRKETIVVGTEVTRKGSIILEF